MHKLKNEINLDRAVAAVENASTGEKPMNNSSTKTPWHLRFAPGAILRPIGRLVSKAVSLASAIIQPIRRRLNQWNWRKKTALVTALAITAAGNFVYQYKANAAWPAVIAAAYGTDFFVKLFTGYAITQGLNAAFNTAILKETAIADTDTWLYSKRKLRVRRYEFDDDGSNKTLVHSVDAQAEANQLKAYDTSSTDSRNTPSTLDADDVLDYYVNHNAALRRGIEVTYAVLVLRNGSWEPLYTWDRRRPETRYLETYTDYYGGYVKPLTDAEIQEDLDKRRRNWYNPRARWRWPVTVGPLKKGHSGGPRYEYLHLRKGSETLVGL